MVKRTEPRSRTDERVFPVRIRFKDDGSRPDWYRWNEAEAWLNDQVGRGNWARHGSGQDIVLHLRTPEAGQRFVDAFPHFELRDYTDTVDYLRAAKNPTDYGTFADLGKRAR